MVFFFRNEKFLMTLRLNALVAIAAFLTAASVAVAHHSIAMFDQEHPIELVGTVAEYRFVSPHVFVFLEVRGEDSPPMIWRLEGNSPNSLTLDGWSSRTLRRGDQIRMMIEPLRSGAPGGAWTPKKTTFIDGTPITAKR
jgi:hypothetical protein